MTAMTDNTTHAHAHAHAPVAHAAQPAAEAHGQQHPIKLYLLVWTLLFVLSACSYLVDYFDFHGLLRWTLIVVFMLLKAGLIVAVFMHMAWERLALVVAILGAAIGGSGADGDDGVGRRIHQLSARVLLRRVTGLAGAD